MNKYITTYGRNGYFTLTNLFITQDTRIKAKFMLMDDNTGFIFGDYADSYNFAFFAPNNSFPHNTIRWYIYRNEGIAFSAASVSDVIGVEFDFEATYNTTRFNTYTASTVNNYGYSIPKFGIGYSFQDVYDRQKPVRWEYFQLYDGQTLVYDLVPAFNNGVYCFKNKVDNTYLYATGNVDGVVSSISAGADTTTLKSSGGTSTISVSCDNSFEVTDTDNWLTLSATGGTGDATITATAPAYTGTTNRESTLTFTDTTTGDEAEITIKQRKYSSGQPVYLGSNEVTELYLGDFAISEAYLGTELVFSSGPFVGLKISPKEITFGLSSLEKELKIKSSEPWTLTVPAWITADVLTGDTGETIVSLTATTQSATTSGTIVATSTNYSASATCNFSVYQELAYVHSSQMGNSIMKYLNTNLYPTLTMKGELKGQFRGYNTGAVLVGTADNDSQDWRLFVLSNTNWYMDVANGRRNGSVGSLSTGQDFDYEFGNLYIKNLDSGVQISGATQSGTIETKPIKIDMGIVWIKELKLWDNNTLIFDGVAAELGGEYGLYDLVTDTLFTDPTLNIVGEL